MSRIRNHGRIRAAGLVILAACFFIAWTLFPIRMDPAGADDKDSADAKKAFAEAAEVLLHPRCVNCHPTGDAPRIREDSQPHAFNVKRGPDGKGAGALKCAMCHRDANQTGGPPGVPNWHMPPENMPMVFQGRTPGELCRQLKDPKQNGGRTGEAVIGHIDRDPLVLWGWNPGEGRAVPKMSHKAFSDKLHEWLKKGAACPE
ncbi:MAG: hypothetical protein A4E73_03193 [Syntrophaceae bacterium PtaU1.Bin231]|jgi:cytochrome c553|nr:MAG: hypothetical protein A4E73_03193 [Syntrophaceae bacterium PtaU1.Bin231]